MAANDILVAADVKDYANISGSAQDTWLAEVITDVSTYIEKYCKRKFASQSVANEIYDGDSWRISANRRRIYTTYFPIIQLSTETTPTDAQKLASVQDRVDPDSAWTDIETDVDHIFLDTDNWSYIELYDEVFEYGRRNIRLNYKAGYSSIPGDIKNVCMEMVVMMYKESARSGLGLLGQSSRSGSGAGVTETKSLLDLDERWKKVLNRYRVPTI